MSVPVYYYTRADVRLVYDLSAVTVCSLLGYGALRNWPDWYRHRRIWGGGRPCPLELGPSKFQERPPGPSGMQENLLAAGALPEPHWGRLQRSPDPVASGEGLDAFSSATPLRLSAIWTSGFGPWGLRIGGLAHRNMMGWIHLWVYTDGLQLRAVPEISRNSIAAPPTAEVSGCGRRFRALPVIGAARLQYQSTCKL